LQDLVYSNSIFIKYNNEKVENLCNKVSGEKPVSIKHLYQENLQITKKNIQYVELHSKLLFFIKSLNKEIKSDIIENAPKNRENKNSSIQVPFDFKKQLTDKAEGSIEFNEQHQFYQSEINRKELLNYYSQKENYDKCTTLLIYQNN
jgi:hypothetical protein